MKKIVFLPLDERPCNYKFPQFLYKNSVDLIVPPAEILGDKKKPANVDGLSEFLRKEYGDADALVLSLDMLVYGGLLPSRLHYFETPTIEGRLNVLEELKRTNPKLKIYAFSLIMRCPKYSSDDEEPDYYADCGAEIHKLGVCLHKKKLGLEDDETQIAELERKITAKNLDDYLSRRKKNIAVNIRATELRKAGVIDYLVIPQDDSAPYGFTAMDQVLVRDKINALGLSAKILMYPGADETGLALLSHCLNDLYGKKPAVYIRYAAENASAIIPPYEDRPMGETVKYHVMAAGGRLASCFADSDVVLCLTAPSKGMTEARYQNKHTVEYDCFRNVPELIDFVSVGKPFIIADNAYANGGELALLNVLNEEKLLDKPAAYAGWNTNANTLGTALAQGFLYLINGATKEHYDFLALRYVEDFGYCGKVRFLVADNMLSDYGYDYFYVENERGVIAEKVKAELEKFVAEHMSSVADEIEIADVYMPWRRMFEAGITAKWKKSDEKSR